MAAADSARAFYNSARAELIERIRLRDQIFVFYLAGVGAVFGVALGAANKSEVLMLVPFLGLGASMLICQHFAVIGALATYCVHEVGPFLRSISPSEDAPQWDDSKALAEYSYTFISLRSWGHALLIILPSAAAMAVNWRHGFYSPFPFGILWWVGVVSLLAAGVVIWRTHRFRRTIYEKMSWRK